MPYVSIVQRFARRLALPAASGFRRPTPDRSVEFAAFAAVVYPLVRQLAPPGVAWAGVALAVVYKLWAFPHWQMYSYSTTVQLALALGGCAGERARAAARARALTPPA